MNTKSKLTIHFLSILLFYSISPSIKATLTKTDWQDLFKKKMVKEIKEIKGYPWPEVTLWAIIDKSTITSASIFSAYENQKKFIPGLIKSIPIKQITPTDIHVFFEKNMPWPLSNITYTTGNRLKKLNNNTYQISWYYVKADNLKDNYGTAIFSPLSNNKTLLTYQSFSNPSSTFARLIEGKMIRDISQTVMAIIKYIESQNNNNIIKYKKRLNDALIGKSVYKKIIQKYTTTTNNNMYLNKKTF